MYRLQIFALWRGPWRDVPEQRRDAALRIPLQQIASEVIGEAGLTRESGYRLARRLKFWYRKHLPIFPELPDATLVKLELTVLEGGPDSEIERMMIDVIAGRVKRRSV